MKKVLLFALVLIFCSGICACGNVPEPIEDNNTQSTETTNNQSTETTNNQSMDKTEESLISSINDLCLFLETNSLVSGTKTVMDATMIGAVEGYKYSDSKVEIYMFEANAPSNVELSGFGLTITFDVTKGKFAIFCAEATNRSAIISAVSTLEIK